MGRVFFFPLPNSIAVSKAVQVSTREERSRFSLRARSELQHIGAAIGCKLPRKIGESLTAGDLEIACLGPDEWVLVAKAEAGSKITADLAAIYDQHPHSLTDVSGREITFDISGEKAVDLIEIACPRNIDEFSVGTARRTVFDGVTVTLWRVAEDHFRMDVWNSFALYLAQTFDTASKELALELH